ncbi:MAG: enoyl-CoA hydratase-related protein [Deltaproteobacteria bacterium]|nr:enoyl-CoA hydratase-related protein [Deltaproteobacteria bacterium]
MTEELILVEREELIAVVRLNRPKALNALSPELMSQLTAALEELDRDTKIRAIVLTGSEKAFAAGADIKEMASLSAAEMKKRDLIGTWDRVARIKKPIVAAVSGFCLGGGCELSMMCDIIIASDTAKFGQLEINLGIIPGAGGTQRLPKLIGKSKAMEWILSGKIYDAQEACQAGLVTRVVPVEQYLEEAKKLARTLAEKSPIALAAAKKAILQSFELPLAEGLQAERNLFYDLFDTQDQKEGMAAFAEKRKPQFKGN